MDDVTFRSKGHMAMRGDTRAEWRSLMSMNAFYNMLSVNLYM